MLSQFLDLSRLSRASPSLLYPLPTCCCCTRAQGALESRRAPPPFFIFLPLLLLLRHLLRSTSLSFYSTSDEATTPPLPFIFAGFFFLHTRIPRAKSAILRGKGQKPGISRGRREEGKGAPLPKIMMRRFFPFVEWRLAISTLMLVADVTKTESRLVAACFHFRAFFLSKKHFCVVGEMEKGGDGNRICTCFFSNEHTQQTH